jgi:hypothetical protein
MKNVPTLSEYFKLQAFPSNFQPIPNAGYASEFRVGMLIVSTVEVIIKASFITPILLGISFLKLDY